MRCRECGTEIAEKALVCFKCGAATTEPAFSAPAGKGQSSWLTLTASALALALLVTLAIYLGRVQPGGGANGSVSWIIAGVAIVVVVLRAVGRRAGR